AGAGDPAEVIRLAPEDMNPTVVACFDALKAPAASRDPAVRRTGVDKLLECTQRNFQNVAPGTVAIVAAALGEKQSLIRDEPNPGAIKYGSGNMTQIFLPVFKDLRADPRFVQYAEWNRLFAFWRDTKLFPDFCVMEVAPVCDA